MKEKKVPNNLELVIIAGTRPEVIKLSELVKSSFKAYKNAFLYTGQHYSKNMKDIFFDELELQPDYDLRSDTSDVDILKDNIAKFLRAARPAYVIVYGDTNSSLAGALAAKDVNNCKLIHIEAGLRSFDMSMVEERNRIEIDNISHYLFAPTELSRNFLKYQDIEKNVFVTGNLIVDVCRKYSQFAELKERNDLPSEFILLTLHRAENVNDPRILQTFATHLSRVKYRIVFPVHPQTTNNLAKYNIQLPDNVITINPLGYLDFLTMLKKCMLTLTDSGGIQEEAVILGKPCITLRNSTERWETLFIKANRLFPLDPHQKNASLNDIIEEMLSARITVNPYGEGVTTYIKKLIDTLMSTTTM